MRVYDYHDALERVEQLREWYESDPEGEQVELPAVDAGMPPQKTESTEDEFGRALAGNRQESKSVGTCRGRP